MTEYIVNADEENSLMYGRKYEELIRCKDCKWYRENECYAWDDGTVAVASETPDDGFCYRAERRKK